MHSSFFSFFLNFPGREGGKVFFLLFEFLFLLREVYYKTIIIFLYYRVASWIKRRVFSGSPPSKHFYFEITI